jgi:hypothetical protein
MRKGIDLNSKRVQPMLPQLLRRRRADEFWQIDLCTTDGLSSCESIAGASGAIKATTNSKASLVGTSSFAWRLRN